MKEQNVANEKKSLPVTQVVSILCALMTVWYAFHRPEPIQALEGLPMQFLKVIWSIF